MALNLHSVSHGGALTSTEHVPATRRLCNTPLRQNRPPLLVSPMLPSAESPANVQFVIHSLVGLVPPPIQLIVSMGDVALAFAPAQGSGVKMYGVM